MEKRQESINKDLELNNKHTETNNTITETKNTLEGINSRISEAEEWIGELEDKMVEITSEEQNKKKEWKEVRIVSETSGTVSNASTFKLLGPRRREKERVWEIFQRDYSWKFLQHGKENIQSNQRGAESPIQHKSKEKHAKTHTNQTNKD